ncbi:MAG: alpha/beta fold hydrolase [Pseudomonadales bacterium]
MAAVLKPYLKFQSVNGVKLAYFEWGQPRAGQPTLLFVHATGFHGRVWDRVIESFVDAYHVISLEQRGHGRSDPVPVEHWQTFGEDLVGFIDALGLQSLFGIAHSMGAHAMVDAAARQPSFARMLLLDPTIPAPEAFQPSVDYQTSFPNGVHPATKRRRTFASPEEMIERLRPKGSFSLFEPRVLRDYCVYGLVPRPEGGFELLCKPEVEAQVYLTARTNAGIHQSVSRVDVPVVVMRAQEPPAERNLVDFSYSPTWPGLAARFPQGVDLHLPDCSHFIPMQVPDQVIAQIYAQLA